MRSSNVADNLKNIFLNSPLSKEELFDWFWRDNDPHLFILCEASYSYNFPDVLPALKQTLDEMNGEK